MTTYEAICRALATLESGVRACSDADPQQQLETTQGEPAGATDAVVQAARDYEQSLTAQLLAPIQLMAAHQVCLFVRVSCVKRQHCNVGSFMSHASPSA